MVRNVRNCKEMCTTRLVEHHEDFKVFSDLILPTVSCLEAIVNSSVTEWNRESRADAHSLLLAISQFAFIVALEAAHSVLSYTRALSIRLQGQYMDIL